MAVPDLPAPDPTPAWSRRLWDAPWLWLALVVGLFCVPMFVGLDRQDLDNDEAIYAFGVDRMLDTGDWLTPRTIEDERLPFLEKPPLKFWIVGLPIRMGLLPHNAFGLRFWDALMGSVAFLYIFGIGRRLGGPVCGMVAVLLLFVNIPLVFQHGLRTHNMEAAVFLSYAAGVYHVLAWRSDRRGARRHVLAMALAFVLAFMTKFVAALFLPLLLVLAMFVTADDRRRLRRDWRMWAAAALLALALIAPWFVYQYAHQGRLLVDQMFGEHVVKRLTAYLDPTHVQPWHFYVTEHWHQLRNHGAAWLSVAGAVLLLWRTIRRRWVEGALVLAWFALPVATISFGTSKLYHYEYPFLPALALAGGYAAAELARLIWRWLERPLEGLMIVRAFVTLALVLLVLPLGAYRTSVAVARSVHRPLQVLRECLSSVAERERGAAWIGSGVWVEGRVASYVYKYYLRDFGPWQHRDAGSDATVAMNLYVPASYRLVLLTRDRYVEFRDHLNTDFAGLLAQVARKAEVEPVVLAETMTPANIRMVMFPDEAAPTEVLLLPGPYGVCGSGSGARSP